MQVGRAWRLPAFQFTDQGELPGWRAVCPRIPTDLSLVAVERWLNLPNADLVMAGEPVSPRAWLETGGPAAPVAAIAVDLV